MDKRKNDSLLSKILKPVITFLVVFALCILLLPLLILKSTDPNSLISASVILTLALSSMLCGVSAKRSFKKNKFLTGIITGLIISGILFLVSRFFSSEQDASAMQIIFLYGTPVVFSLIGTNVATKRNKSRKRKKR